MVALGGFDAGDIELGTGNEGILGGINPFLFW